MHLNGCTQEVGRAAFFPGDLQKNQESVFFPSWKAAVVEGVILTLSYLTLINLPLLFQVEWSWWLHCFFDLRSAELYCLQRYEGSNSNTVGELSVGTASMENITITYWKIKKKDLPYDLTIIYREDMNKDTMSENLHGIIYCNIINKSQDIETM